MTDFFTLCWKSARLDLVAACLLALVLGSIPGHAAEPESVSEVSMLRLERTQDGIDLYATVRLELTATVTDALEKGIPMVFLAEAEVMRSRWYWADKKVASAQRHMRLAFQPLTRRWRLNVASGPISSNSLGLALNLNFDSLDEAMATLQRISAWKIADAGQIDADGSYRVEFRFGLDVSQLPRPFQIGAFGQSDWKVSASAVRQLSPENPK
ncbi:MAG: DUF4390 domain-containing protein [Burkholderiaceae bacterium]